MVKKPMAAGPLDHDVVTERGLIERYHLGTLSAEEEERFEAHYLDCAQCQEELEAQRSFVRGMKTVAAEDAARSAVGLGLLAWLVRRGAGVAWALAALAVVVGALASAHLWRQNERLETRVAELSTGYGPTGPAGDGLGVPLAGVPVTLLGVLRGEDGAPPVIDPGGGPYSLAVDAGADPRFASYAVTLVDAAGEVRYERHGLLPNDLEVIQLTLPADFLPPGEYRFVLRGTRPGGESEQLASHELRVAHAR